MELPVIIVLVVLVVVVLFVILTTTAWSRSATGIDEAKSPRSTSSSSVDTTSSRTS